jgi:hypothetical protein
MAPPRMHDHVKVMPVRAAPLTCIIQGPELTDVISRAECLITWKGRHPWCDSVPRKLLQSVKWIQPYSGEGALLTSGSKEELALRVMGLASPRVRLLPPSIRHTSSEGRTVT